MVPLQQDVTRLQRRLRLKPEAAVKDITLDLRKHNDRERSRLLHRLNLLGVPWGEQRRASGLGTFKEAFRLEWQPGLARRPDPRGPLGDDGRGRRGGQGARARRREQESIAALAQLADAVLLADLPDALDDVMRALADQAALDRDTSDLMTRRPAAGRHPALRRRARQRHERGRRGAAAGSSCAARSACPGAGVGLDEETGKELASLVDGVNGALALLEDADLTRAWREALRRVADGDRLPGSLAGRATRLLHDAGEYPDVAAAMARAPLARRGARARRELDRGLHRHQRPRPRPRPRPARRPRRLDRHRRDDAFTDVLPLLRRAFSVLPAGERRRLGERLRAT